MPSNKADTPKKTRSRISPEEMDEGTRKVNALLTDAPGTPFKTARQLATALEVSENTVSRWTHQKGYLMSRAVLGRIRLLYTILFDKKAEEAVKNYRNALRDRIERCDSVDDYSKKKILGLL